MTLLILEVEHLINPHKHISSHILTNQSQVPRPQVIYIELQYLAVLLCIPHYACEKREFMVCITLLKVCSGANTIG